MDRLPLQYQTISGLADGIRKGEMTSTQLVQNLLDRIKSLDGQLNAFRLTCPELALEQAAAADRQIRDGKDPGILHGIPYAVKDLFDVKGLPTTAGASLFGKNIAAADAHAVQQLNRAGMILLGKTNTVQFAYSGVGINHDHGTPQNPWSSTHHVPGGSSSGSAVAVAAGMVPMALGTDTGGSVRVPASLCGTAGLKTTVGRVGRGGVYPLSWSLDSVGALARSVEDADPEIEKAVRACGKVFEELGAKVSSIEFSEAQKAQQLNSKGLIIAAEAYTLNKKWLEEHFDRLDPIVAHRMIKGKDIEASEYLQNNLAWRSLRAEALNSLSDVDALLVPATAIPAMPTAEIDAHMDIYAERNLSYLRNTAIGNVLNMCGLSVPCGFTKKGLPIGLMIYAKPFQENVVLRAGYAFQAVTDWHRRMPDLSWVV